MTALDELNIRLAPVRARFADALDGKIADCFTALEKMSGDGETTEIVVVAHRRLHELCGVAPTLGFAGTGKAARSAESTIRKAAKAKRVLNPAEIAALKMTLEVLRQAAVNELQAFANRS